MITLSDAKLSRSGKVLIENISLTLEANKRYGLVGRNGSGKTSFLSVLLGKTTLDSGEITIQKSYKISCMEQEIHDLNKTALDYVLDGDTRFRETQRAIAQAEASNKQNKLAELHEYFNTIGGYTAEAKAQSLLYGLGFSSQDSQKLVSSFSGGWRMRLNLAKTLMSPAEIILLDEPTNHLDLAAILWLQNYLINFSGMLVIISHDREFLDATTTHTIHIDLCKINLYSGNYSQFEKYLADKISTDQATFVKQQKKRKQLQTFVDRFGAKASKAKQAQSKAKALAKLDMQAPIYSNSKLSFSFEAANVPRGPLINLDKLHVGYSKENIVLTADINILANSRIGLLGNNGSGKTTLLRTIVGDLDPISGNLEYSANIKIGYFSQHQLEILDQQLTPLEQMQILNPDVREQDLRNFLGSFSFCHEYLQKKIKLFSGGEKSKLALAIICWQKPNLLILDEPTNHLDFDVRFALIKALENYNGGLILVSHDRNILRSTVDEFYLIENNQLNLFDGDLNDYEQQILKKITTTKNTESANKLDNKAEKRKHAATLREAIKPLKNKVISLENKIDNLHSQITTNDKILADSQLYDNKEGMDKIKQTIVEQSKLKQQLDEIEELWLTEKEKLENLIQK
jgi:ATP-binding cassette subfamily F protein 3